MRRIPRRLARAPISIFKAGFGAVFAGRLIMLEHVGRKTGLSRYVVVEAMLRGPSGFVVPSGYGRASNWVRNVEANPDVRMWWGFTRAAPGRAEVLDPDTSRELLERYRRNHRFQARLAAFALKAPELGAEDLPADIGERIPLVRLFRA